MVFISGFSIQGITTVLGMPHTDGWQEVLSSKAEAAIRADKAPDMTVEVRRHQLPQNTQTEVSGQACWIAKALIYQDQVWH